MKKLFFIIAVFFSTISSGFADGVKFSASAPGQVIKGQTFQITFTLINANGQDLRVPEFPGCNVLFGPAVSQGSQFTSINGKTTTQTEESYTYTLKAIKEGTYKIGSATIRAGGKQLTSNTLNLKILPPDKNSDGGSDDDREYAPSAQSSAGTDATTFARLILSRTKVYEQEAILATIKLYTKAANMGLENYTFPSFDGFVVQDMPIQNPQFELDHYDGANYTTVVIKRALLFPQRSGKITINPGKFDMALQVVRPMRGPFGMMRGLQEVKKTVRTQPVTVEVLPLPAGKPASYMGAVGTFTVTSSINRENLKTNEAVTVKLQIKGVGNLKYVKNPEIKFPADFEVYDPKIDVKTQNTMSGVEGVRTIEYTAIPRNAGDFVIPGIDFSYFDVHSNSYKTLTTPEYHLKVEKGTGGSSSQISNFTDKETLQMLNQDIHFIKTGNLHLQKSPSIMWGSTGYWLWYILPALFFIIFVIINRKQARENANVTLMKTKKANKVATRRLKAAGKYLKEHQKEAFYNEVLQAVWGYLSDKLSLPLSELTRDNVATELAKYGASEDLVNHFMEILDTCEFAQYAPSQSDSAMDKLYADTVEVIGKMENTVKK